MFFFLRLYLFKLNILKNVYNNSKPNHKASNEIVISSKKPILYISYYVLYLYTVLPSKTKIYYFCSIINTNI